MLFTNNQNTLKTLLVIIKRFILNFEFIQFMKHLTIINFHYYHEFFNYQNLMIIYIMIIHKMNQFLKFFKGLLNLFT